MSGLFGENVARLRHKSVEWYTPAWLFEELDIAFDLDPASPLGVETPVPAALKLTYKDDGLSVPWSGRVWLNPPYGPTTGFWMRRMCAHANGIALVFSRTDSLWFQQCMQSADAVLFIAGRIQFIPGAENKHKRSRCGAGTAIFAWGSECASALRKISNRGVLIQGMNDGR